MSIISGKRKTHNCTDHQDVAASSSVSALSIYLFVPTYFSQRCFPSSVVDWMHSSHLGRQLASTMLFMTKVKTNKLERL